MKAVAPPVVSAPGITALSVKTHPIGPVPWRVLVEWLSTDRILTKEEMEKLGSQGVVFITILELEEGNPQ